MSASVPDTPLQSKLKLRKIFGWKKSKSKLNYVLDTYTNRCIQEVQVLKTLEASRQHVGTPIINELSDSQPLVVHKHRKEREYDESPALLFVAYYINLDFIRLGRQLLIHIIWISIPWHEDWKQLCQNQQSAYSCIQSQIIPRYEIALSQNKFERGDFRSVEVLVGWAKRNQVIKQPAVLIVLLDE